MFSRPVSTAVRCSRSFTSLVPAEHAFINGKWTRSNDGQTFPVYNPSNGDKLTTVADMTATETKEAIKRSETAFKEWKLTTAKERSMILKKWHNLLISNRDELARIVTLEQGKPLSDSHAEIDFGASYVEWYAEEATRVYGDVIPSPTRDSRILVTKGPVGLCGLITPWNFPLAMLLRKASPALAAGCVVIAKPSEDTPVSALAMAKLAHDAGVPDGVLNVVTASTSRTPDVGMELCQNPKIASISFTGSVEVGKILLAQSASTVKKCCMELGGNSAFIVFESADIDAAVSGAMASKFRNTGQACIASNRFYVHDSVYDEFRDKLVATMSDKLVMNDGLEPGANIGPLINSASIDKIKRLVNDALSKGGRAALGGACCPDRQGNFYQPTVLTEITENMAISQEEIFGPIIAIQRFKSEVEVLKVANSSLYGLASYFYSREPAQIWRVAEALEVGMVGVNEGSIASAVVPMGGVKESGLGREGAKYGLEEYLELKYIRMGGV